VVDSKINRRRVVAATAFLVLFAVVLLARDQRPLDLWSHVAFRGGWPLAVGAIAGHRRIRVFPQPSPRRERGSRSRSWSSCCYYSHPVRDLPERDNPYPSQAWVTFLQQHTQDQSRVFSTQALLYPDFAGAYGLSDPRILDALFPARYWQYLRTFISHGLVDRFTAVDPNETIPAVASNPMFDLLGIRYLLYTNAPTSKPPPTGVAVPPRLPRRAMCRSSRTCTRRRARSSCTISVRLPT